MMKAYALLPLLVLGACSVDRDGTNDQVTLEYNETRIREGAAEAEETAREVGAAAGNVASQAGAAIRNEVGDIDVDVDVRRNGEAAGEAEGNAQ